MTGPAPSPEKVAASRFTKAQLAAWGYGWPPPRGWRLELRRKWEAQERAKRKPPIDLEEVLELQEWI